jgi:hypothetical protein
MHGRTRWIAGIAVMAIVAGLVAIWFGRAGNAPVPVAGESDAPEVAAGTDAAADADATQDTAPASAASAGASNALRAAPSSAARPALPLPPPGAPLAGILDDLERRARAGDARAACRLAAEIGRCAGLARRQALPTPLQYPAASPGGNPVDDKQLERYVDFAARQQLELERDETVCAGVPRERLRDATPWLLAAARGGNTAAMVVYVSGMWTAVDPYALRHADVLAAYSREAERMALALVEAGSPELVRSLGMAYAGGAAHGALGSVVEPDPVRGHALLRLLLEPGQNSTRAPAPAAASSGQTTPSMPEQRAFQALDATLDPAQRAASDAMFARLRARRTEFDARQPARMPSRTFVNSILQPDACDR